MSIKLDLGSEWVLIREESYNQTELLEALKKVILDEEQKKLLVYDAAERGFIDVVSYYVDKISEEEKDEEFYNCLLLQTLYCKEKTYELFCEVLKLVKIDEISLSYGCDWSAMSKILMEQKNPRSFVKALLNAGYTFTDQDFDDAIEIIEHHDWWSFENFIEIFSFDKVFDKLSDTQKSKVTEIFLMGLGYEGASERINMLNTDEYKKLYSYMLTQNLSQENIRFLDKLRLCSSPVDMAYKFSKQILEKIFNQVEDKYVIAAIDCEPERVLSYCA